MPRNVGAKEAAMEINADVRNGLAHVDPEHAHQAKFLKEVCEHLGIEPLPENIGHVASVLRQHDIAIHAGHEFPKYAARGYDGVRKIVANEQEEQEWVDETQPELVAPLGRTIEAPVQDLSVDLRTKVPHMVEDMPPAERPARIPSAVTNREAAQDAHARQPVETLSRADAAVAYDKANPGLDHTNQDAARGVDTFEDVQGNEFDDDDVHVEDVDLLADTGSHQQGGAPYKEPADVGVMAGDDPDGDGIVGQDKDPTHDSVLGTERPKNRSGDSSAGKTDTATRPVGNRRPM